MGKPRKIGEAEACELFHLFYASFAFGVEMALEQAMTTVGCIAPLTDESPVPMLELLGLPTADVPSVPTLELDCASAVLANNAATTAEISRIFI